MRRALAALVAGLLLLLLAGVVARQLALARVEAVLRARGVEWGQRRSTLASATWVELRGPGVQLDRLELSALPQPTVQLDGLTIELDALPLDTVDPDPLTPDTPPGGAGVGLTPSAVGVRDLSLRWRGETVLSGLSGSLLPEVDLRGPDGTVRRVEGRWQGQLRRRISLGPLRASVDLSVQQDGETVLRFEARSDDMVVEHPLLASAPVGPWSAGLRGSWDRSSGELLAEAELNGLQATVRGTLQPGPLAARLELQADELAFAEVIALFGEQIPEARRARCDGRLGISLELSGPPLAWSARPSAEDLACEGLLHDADALRSGTVRWRARQADGSPMVASTGPGQPGFTPWLDGQRLADAFIASEDIRFLSHPGYDLAAIQEAIDEAAAGEERPRGGSTITQQLAKNLYTGDDRTLVRKLRELMYSLDLEASLSKRHILQLYINIVELGPDLHGVGPAADLYFAKDARGLSDKEAAFLATLLPSPVSGHGRASQGRVSEAKIEAILSTMERARMRSPEQIAAARRQRLVLLVQPPAP